MTALMTGPALAQALQPHFPDAIVEVYAGDIIVDRAAVVEQAVERVENHGIVFLDEIDKVCGPSSGHGPDVSRQGVQRDLLPVVEGTTVNTKHGPVRTDHILFIVAGAFHVSKPAPSTVISSELSVLMILP